MKKPLILLLLLSSSIVFGQTTIQMIKKDGVLYVPCKVNGLALNFIFDTGASNVTISLTEAYFMLKNGYLDENDIIGASSSQLANRELTNSTAVLLKQINIGGIKIYNVRASIINHCDAPLLLGQTAMAKLGSFQIDPVNGTITISSKGIGDIKATPIDSTVVMVDSTTVTIDTLAEIKAYDNQAIISDPHNENAYYKRGYAKFTLKDYTGAIADFTKIIENDPKNRDAYYWRAYSKQYSQDYKGAIADFTKIIENDPNEKSLYLLIGDVKSILKDFSGAIADYNKDLQDLEAYVKRGDAKFQLDDNYGAISDYTKVIDTNPEYDEAYVGRGDVKRYLKDYYGAIADYTKAIDINDSTKSIGYMDDTEAYEGRGKAKWHLNDNNGAIEDFTKAIEIYPKKANLYYYRGLVLIDNGQKESGCFDLSKAGELGYKDAYEDIKKYCQ